MNNQIIKQCRVCGAVVQTIRTPNTTIHADVKPMLIYPMKHGSDHGYTQSGRRIDGYFLQSGEKHDGYEVYRQHLCARTNPPAAAVGK